MFIFTLTAAALVAGYLRHFSDQPQKPDPSQAPVLEVKFPSRNVASVPVTVDQRMPVNLANVTPEVASALVVETRKSETDEWKKLSLVPYTLRKSPSSVSIAQPVFPPQSNMVRVSGSTGVRAVFYCGKIQREGECVLGPSTTGWWAELLNEVASLEDDCEMTVVENAAPKTKAE